MDNDNTLAPTTNQAEAISPELFTQQAKQALLTENKLTEEGFNALGLLWSDLEDIARRHNAQMGELDKVANFISATLQSASDRLVHSTRVRVKNPQHLVSKIIRKRKEDPNRVITPDNYEEQITDLIGVRVIHLTRERWIAIDSFIRETWSLKKKEPVVAHLRDGDPIEWEEMYRKSGCVIKKLKPYRSVHYVITVAPTKKTHHAEIQVRTLFDEGWSELDHELNYPAGTEDLMVVRWLRLLNVLSGAADELAAFLMNFMESQETQTEERENLLQQAQTLETRMNDLLKERDIDAAKLAELRTTNDQLRAANSKLREIEGVKTLVDWVAGPHPLLELIERQQQSRLQQAVADMTSSLNNAALSAAMEARNRVWAPQQAALEESIQDIEALGDNSARSPKGGRAKARAASPPTHGNSTAAPKTKTKEVEPVNPKRDEEQK
jgi:ppGpp synthetase/RelA/SpoT-type nucleotidyltranferase